MEEADTLEMSESQAYLATPYFMVNPALNEFETARAASKGGSISSWPEVVNYLLTTYATPSAIRQSIRQAVAEFRAVKQGTNELEDVYAQRVNKATYRCGNAFDEHEKITAFVDGLIPEIRNLVARYRESQSRETLSYEKLVQFAKDEGSSFRTRNKVTTASLTPKLLTQKELEVRKTKPQRVHFAESLYQIDDEGSNDILGALFGDADSSIPTSELPSTTPSGSTEETDPIAYGERRVMPPRLPYESNATRNARTGWGDAVKLISDIICYLCYGKGHMASRCPCILKDLKLIKSNYESLTDEERKRVPEESYKRVCAFLAAGNPGVQQGSTVNSNPKN